MSTMRGGQAGVMMARMIKISMNVNKTALGKSTPEMYLILRVKTRIDHMTQVLFANPLSMFSMVVRRPKTGTSRIT